MKLGDRIAVFGPGGVLEQYDTPEQVLTNPANKFVAEFVGSGAAVRRLSLLELSRLQLEEMSLDGAGSPNGHPTYRADATGRALSWSHLPGVTEMPPLVTVPLSGTVYDAVDVMLDARTPLVAVVDDQQRPQGALRWDALVGELPTKRRRP
jgi:osmoprotectant transport system ATP-binding protein